MAIKLSSTKNAAIDQGLKILVYGASGSGKTTLCGTTNAPTVIISAEAGLLSLRDKDIDVLEVATISDVHEAYAYLTSAEGQKYQWVCIDSISEVAEVVLSFEKKNSKDARQAYGALAEQMTDLVRAFRDLPGRNVVMTAKMDRIKDDTTGVVLYGPSAPGQRLASALPYFFDLCFAMRVEKDDDTGLPVRAIQTGKDFNYEAKDRSGALNFFESPDLSAIAAKILNPAAVAAETKE